MVFFTVCTVDNEQSSGNSVLYSQGNINETVSAYHKLHSSAHPIPRVKGTTMTF